MFLYARVFALIIYSVIMIIMYILLKKSKSNSAIKRVLFFYIIALSIMAYNYLPYKTADLYGIRNYVTYNVKPLDFSSLISVAKTNRMPVALLYFWIFGKIGNLNLMPAITSFIFYSNVFYIAYKSYEKYEWNKKALAKVILFIMVAGQFLEVISGIRCMMSYSILALCIFKENILGKSLMLDIPLYLCAIFIHDSCFVLAIIGIVLYVLTSKNNAFKKFLYLLLIMIVSTFLLIKNFDYFLSLFNHAQVYISGVDEYGRNTYFYFWEYLNAMLCMIFMLYSIVKLKKMIGKDMIIQKSYLNIFVIVMIIAFCLSFEYSIFERFRTFLMILSIPIIGNIFNSIKMLDIDKIKKRNYYTLYLFFVVMIYAISITRGYLCNLKFFE